MSIPKLRFHVTPFMTSQEFDEVDGFFQEHSDLKKGETTKLLLLNFVRNYRNFRPSGVGALLPEHEEALQ